ncbi:MULTISPECIES: helix-turn-helix transcriptional regulator [Mesorhizobium]|uniref:helix-turn-helix transcriptional regulator n=1 Tax=Mesorhizobium TaxID=68287 RepID=UPI00387E6B7B
MGRTDRKFPWGQHDRGTKGASYFLPAAKRARAALGWGVLELAKEAGVSTQTVVRFERGETLKQSTIVQLKATFEAAGIEFISESGGGPGVRLSRGLEAPSRRRHLRAALRIICSRSMSALPLKSVLEFYFANA